MMNSVAKKVVLGITSLAMSASILTGCASTQESAAAPENTTVETTSQETSKPTDKAETEKVKGVTLTYVASQNWVNKASKIDDELNKMFEEETGIKIDLQVIPDDQYVNLLKTKMGTGEVPDIFMVSAGVGAQKFMPEKYFADLSNEAWVSRYADYAKQGTTIDGKVMGFMTWCVDGWGMLYNKELYDSLGLQVPTSMEEFSNVCETLLANGITPVFESGKEAWHWAIWLSQYGPYVNIKYPGLYDKLNANEIKFADIQELEQFLEELKVLYDKGYLGANSLADSWDASYEKMGVQEAASFVGYQSYQLEVAEKYPDSKAEAWEMYPIPLAGNNVYSHSAGGNMRVAYKDSPHLEYVKQYFDFLARPENLQLFYEKRTDIQPNPSFVDVAGKPTKSGETIMQNCPGGQGIDFEYGVMFWDNTAVGKYIQEMLINQKTAKEVLAAIDNDRQLMFDALN